MLLIPLHHHIKYRFKVCAEQSLRNYCVSVTILRSRDRKMAFRTRRPNQVSDWQPYQALITRLYKDEDRTLEEVMTILETQYGFKAT
jgi:hypothetical protein